jgi:hypothetical protein
VFEGKEKADRVAMAVEKQVQSDDMDGLVPSKNLAEHTHIEEVSEAPKKAV